MGSRIVGELESTTLHGPPLDREIQLALDRALELAGQTDGLYTARPGRLAFHELREVLDDVQVGMDDFGDIRPAHLQGHGPAVEKDRPMDLRDRGRGDRDRVDRNEDFGSGRPYSSTRIDSTWSNENDRTSSAGPPARSYRTRAADRVWC